MRIFSVTAREPYMGDNNIPLPEVSQPFKSAEVNWGPNHELISKCWVEPLGLDQGL